MTENKESLSFLLDKPAIRVVSPEQVLQNLPHREPMLFVDYVNVIEESKYFVGVKTFPHTEEFYKGHFPGSPVTPGVFLLEAMAQSFGAALMDMPQAKGKLPLFLSVDEAKFRCPVMPGDKIIMPLHALRIGRISKMYGEAYVNGKLCSEGKLNFILGDRQ